MHRFNKVLSIGLATLMTCSSLPVFASASSAYKSEGEYKYENSIGSVSSDFTDNGTSVGKDTTQGKESATKHPFVDSSSTTIDATLEQTEVFATVAPAYGIKIPKTLILSASGLGLYDIGVSGDLSGTQKLTIRPVDKIENTDDIDFYMAEQGAFIGAKDDIVAKVDQTKTTWTYSEMKKGEYTWLEEAGKITADDISAGSWAGTFDFLISMGTFEVSQSEYFTLYAPEVDSKSNMSAGSDGTWVKKQSVGSSELGINQVGKWQESEVNLASDSTKALIEQYKELSTTLAEANSISLYSAVILTVLGYSNVQEYVNIAKQGDEAFDNAFAQLKPNGFTDADSLFLKQFGVTAHDLVKEMEQPSDYIVFTGSGTSTAILLDSEIDGEIEIKIALGREANVILGTDNNTSLKRHKQAIEFLAIAGTIREEYEETVKENNVTYRYIYELLYPSTGYYEQGISFETYLNTQHYILPDEYPDNQSVTTYGYTYNYYNDINGLGYTFTVGQILDFLDYGTIPECLYSEELVMNSEFSNGTMGDIDYNFIFAACSWINYVSLSSYTINKDGYSSEIMKDDTIGRHVSLKIPISKGSQTIYLDSFFDEELFSEKESYVNVLVPKYFYVKQTDTEFIPGDDASEDKTWENTNKVYLAIAPEYNYYTEDSFKEFLSTGDESVLVKNTSRKQLPKDLVLPSELYGYKITGLVPYALRGYEEVEYVYVPQTYTELDATALSNTNIREIVIRDGGLTNINADAFNNNANLEIITLPDDIVAIPVFIGCTKLKKVTSN